MSEANTVHKISEVCPYCGAATRKNITEQDNWRMYTCGTIGSFMDGFYVQGGNCKGPELETAPVEETHDEKE